MPYTEYDDDAPVGTTGTGATYSAADLANAKAALHAIITGRAAGWLMTRTAGIYTVAMPQFLFFTKGTKILRATCTWNTAAFQLTSIQWAYSSNSGGAYDNLGAAQGNTYDGTNQVTATTNSGGMTSGILFEIWTKVLKAASDLATHIVATGTAVHGLGTAALANLANLIVTGGSGDNWPLGQTTPREVDSYRLRERVIDLGAQANAATVNFDVASYGYFKVTPHATTSSTLTIGAPSNSPAAGRTQTIVIEIVNGRRDVNNRITWNAVFKWTGSTSAGGAAETKPDDATLEVSGANLFVATWNGASWDISHLGKRGA